MEARYQAEANLLEPPLGAYPSHLQDLNALEAQAQASLEAGAPTQRDAPVENGFDWTALSMGTLGVALLLAGTGFAVQVRRRRAEPAPRTS